jgi:hypothetical protein
MQCMAGAMTAVGATSGTPTFAASRHFSWLKPRRLRALTIVLVTAALLVSATLVSGTGPGSGQQAAGKSPSADRR